MGSSQRACMRANISPGLSARSTAPGKRLGEGAQAIMQLSQYLTGAHIVAEGQLEADVRWEPVAPQWLAGIVGWKALMGHGPETQPQRRAFADGPGHGHYSTALTRFWTDIGKAGQGTPACLIYLHCGLHPDPRTPLLPHLLADLDHRGAVHALRVDTDAALGDALAFAQAMVRRAGRVIVLWDRTERLVGRAPD